ncbi:hypothetical protein [Streptomyces clavuligerus]|uniref:hypothetical protein n=1 Tax=Streptomyces clavuligerus TaxID=1901 RepID=UPI0010FA9312|nr:hypothetical protein [Streptomyces clavuligerus]MBY6307490.1 hypothetical protein [Streptomyces clavuligerus]QPJ98004.1 hypothetical protein GE265_33775 [Streptomyces clavuligerus]WDN56658.1 hypothetical protein LL058_33105 [Streptomyces clavuligerus]
MRKHVQPRGRVLRRIAGASLVSVLAMGTMAGTAPIAAAAPASATGPWSTPTALTGGDEAVNVIDVKTAANGDVVAALYRQVDGTDDLEVRVAVRPANSATWGASTLVDTMDVRKGHPAVRLLPAPDGSVTLTWLRTGPSYTIRTSVLAPGATGWSTPVDIVQHSSPIIPAMAIGPSGSAVMAWRQSASSQSSEILVTQRATPAGDWSTPERLDTTPADTTEGDQQILVAADGSLTVVWNENGPHTSAVMAVDKPAGAAGWTAPRALSAPSSEAHAVQAGQGPDGRSVLLWTSPADTVGGPDTMAMTVREAGSTQWGPVETVAEVHSAVTTRPLVAPNGEITVVWVDHRTIGFGTRAVTRSTAGAWSPVRTLSTDYVPEQFDAEIGPDGTVHVGWVQEASPTWDTGRVFRHAARVDGVWTAPKTLSRTPSAVAIGHVAGGAAGQAAGVWEETRWDEPTGRYIGQIWSAGTGLPGTAARR